MKGEILFEKMTGISEEFITEAALVTPVGVTPTKKNRFASLSSALNSGWGVACICFVVAIAAVAGMVAWGRMGDDIPTVPPVHQPSSRFSFSYDMRSSDGTAWDGTALPGDTVYVDTSVINQGKSFDTYDFFAHAHFVLQGDDTVTLQGVYPVIDTDKHTVDSGDRGSRCFTFFIPENATPGVYDLVLSFDGEEAFFLNVLTVGETEGETYPPASTDHAFSFGYEAVDTVVQPGGRTSITCWTVNDGATFTYTGYPDKYAPIAYLIHSETGDMISGKPAPVDYEEMKNVTVKAGEIAGKASYIFSIPSDAPTGTYALQLSYDGVSKSFAGVVIVAEPTIPDQDELEELWKIAEQLIPQLTPDMDPSDYGRGGSTSSSEGYHTFKFCIEILGIPTKEELAIVLDRNGAYLSHEQDPQTYSLFIPYITEELLESTKPPLYEHPDEPIREDHRYSFTIKNGDLYLVYGCYDPEIVGKRYYYTTVFLYLNPQTPTLSKEEAIDFAIRQVEEQYPDIDLSEYTTRFSGSLSSGYDYTVYFRRLYFGYDVNYGTSIEVDMTTDTSRSSIAITDEFAAYMPALTQEIFLAAIQNISNGIADVDHTVMPYEAIEKGSLYFKKDSEGYLCLTLEHIGPPLYDEDGNNLSGCVDHEHYVFSERLCKIP